MTILRFTIAFASLNLMILTSEAQPPKEAKAGDASSTAGLTQLPETPDLYLIGRVVVDEGFEVSSVALWKTENLDGSRSVDHSVKRRAPDADGGFRFEGLTPGYYAIAAYGRVSTGDAEQTFNYYIKRLVIREAEKERPMELRIPPEGFTLHGRVLHGEVPLSGIRVVANSDTPTRRSHFSHYSDEEGNFVIRGLSEGGYTIELQMHDAGNGEDSAPRRQYPFFHYSVDVQGDLERNFQYSPGHDAEISIEFASEYGAGYADRFRAATLLHANQSHRLAGLTGIVPGNIPTRFASARLEEGKARFTGNFEGSYFVELKGSDGHANLLVPVPLELDTLQRDVQAELQVQPPGRIEVRLEAGEGMGGDFSRVRGYLTLEAMPYYVCSESFSFFQGEIAADEVPAGRYLLNVGDGRDGLMLSPLTLPIEVRPGETTVARFTAEPMRVVMGSVSSNIKASRMLGETVESFEFFSPERIRIDGPESFDLMPPQTSSAAMMESHKRRMEEREDHAFFTGFVLFDPPPGEYTATVTAEDHEPLVQPFIVGEGLGVQQIEFEMRSLN